MTSLKIMVETTLLTTKLRKTIRSQSILGLIMIEVKRL